MHTMKYHSALKKHGHCTIWDNAGEPVVDDAKRPTPGTEGDDNT